ncbi:MAG: 16S rRNA (cytidine(1402)-2'-O)-methyltransferase [Ignavibacteria bacterium]|nr:16S rRNA (cytidine(1402)-2'-O)-methyltransferase [Ignavibacteria bacterium]
MNKFEIEKGALYLVPTPIGNIRDITLRALDVLKQVDIIACEDTRTTSHLLKLLELPSKELISYYDSIETKKAKIIIEKLKLGNSVALISDAGTPLISDPGYRLLTACISEGIKVIPLPGPSALLTALIASGLPTHSFKFFGYPPKKKNYKKFIEQFSNEEVTSIAFVSPHQIKKFVTDLANFVEKNRKVCVARELTKLHEEFFRGSFEEMLDFIQKKEDIKGEIVFLIEGKE